jgi:hypothetical protein
MLALSAWMHITHGYCGHPGNTTQYNLIEKGEVMSKAIKAVCLVVFLSVAGCAHIDFGGDGMTYFDPKPYLFVSTTKQCVATATVVVVPETKKVMKFVSGYGSADLSVTLSNGMIATVNQKTDTKIPETISAIASLGTAAAGFRTPADTGKQITCPPTAILYPLISGVPDLNNPIPFPFPKETGDLDKPGK